MGRIYDQCEHCGEMYDEHDQAQGNWPCQCEGSKQARIDCEKAALKQALTYIAAGAGLYGFSRGEAISSVVRSDDDAKRRFCVAMAYLDDSACSKQDYMIPNDATLEELVDELWEMGVRA